MWYVGLEADALLLAVVADVNAGRGLLVHDMLDRMIELAIKGHVQKREFIATLMGCPGMPRWSW